MAKERKEMARKGKETALDRGQGERLHLGFCLILCDCVQYISNLSLSQFIQILGDCFDVKIH